jgi:hypothetical protein
VPAALIASPQEEAVTRIHLRRYAHASLLLALLLVAASAGAAPKTKRYGIEGDLVRYDDARDVFVVKVVNTDVKGRFMSGNTVGGAAPSSIQKGSEIEFQVQPEGSVLRRTVIKSQKGGGLDTTGTRAGFARAVKMLPNDRPLVISFEENEKAKVAKGGPAWRIVMVQILLTEEELRERFERITQEE